MRRNVIQIKRYEPLIHQINTCEAAPALRADSSPNDYPVHGKEDPCG